MVNYGGVVGGVVSWMRWCGERGDVVDVVVWLMRRCGVHARRVQRSRHAGSAAAPRAIGLGNAHSRDGLRDQRQG